LEELSCPELSCPCRPCEEGSDPSHLGEDYDHVEEGSDRGHEADSARGVHRGAEVAEPDSCGHGGESALPEEGCCGDEGCEEEEKEKAPESTPDETRP